MTRKRPAQSPKYDVSDEAAAYIADALMELALFTFDSFGSIAATARKSASARSNWPLAS